MTLKRTLLGALALVVSTGALAPAAQAQTAGTCALGSAAADLDINNVRARLFNNGGLFWKGAGNVYNVPKAPAGAPITPNAIFASGIWIVGKVGTELRGAAADYANWELWPGPLNADATLPSPANCSAYDKIWLVSREQLREYVFNGTTTPDLTSWPTGLGAPTFVDANRNAVRDPGEAIVVPTTRTQAINLQANQLPLLSGDQMAWWIMNDVGGTKRTTGTKPMGLEVQVSAFAFAREGALGNTTFYRYKLNYRGTQALTEAYMGLWSDPDLGNATDDYVGSDSVRGLGYVYNADNNDESSEGYGTPPPALGYDFFQGPLVPAPGESFTDPDGTVHANMTRLKASGFMYYNNGAGNNGDPRDGTSDWYDYMRGFWQNGSAIKDCGNGDATALASCGPTKFMFPGDPVTGEGWSEFNVFPGTGNKSANAPSDRRFLLSTGPFTINPGDQQTIVYGIVWARGGTNLGSVNALKRSDALAQLAFDNDFILPDAPSAPRVSVAEQNREVVLSWTANPIDNNFQNAYRAPIQVAGQTTYYDFEGFNIYRYPSERYSSEEAELVATYDKINGVTQVIEGNDLGTTSITADGSDNGLQFSIRFTGLTNYKKYYYGVQSYAYNPDVEVEKVLRSQVTTVTAMPQPTTAAGAGTSDVTGNYAATITGTPSATTTGQGNIYAQVVDPTRVTGNDYRVTFYEYTFQYQGRDTTVFAYDITNVQTGAKAFDGRAYAQRTGMSSPQTAAETGGEGPGPSTLATADGLQFFVGGPVPGYLDFRTTSNAAGPLNPPEYGAADPNHRGFPRTVPDGDPRYDIRAGMQSTNASAWGIQTANTGASDPPAGYANSFEYFVSRTLRDGANLEFLGSHDYEWRFTAAGGKALVYFDGGTPLLINVPFELWDIGLKADASDDMRLIPLLNPIAGGQRGVWDLGNDHPTSGGLNDPQTDWVYWYTPVDETPGQVGYNKWVADATANAGNLDQVNHEIMARLVLVNFNGGNAPAGPFNATMPETGTTFRIVTAKPNAAGDAWTIATAPFAAQTGQDSLFQAAIDRIGISPNPYRGASDYETSNLADLVRFTGLPERATIRVFTLSGTLIRTLSKSGPDRFLEWDLQTESRLPIASGMYLIHVDVLDANGQSVGEKVLKFGVVKKRIQLDLL